MDRCVIEDSGGGDDSIRETGADDAVGAALHTLRGEVLRTVFSSDDGSYVVLKLLDTDGAEQTVVGALGGVLEGQEIEAAGRWENHREHGRQFRIVQFKAVLPSNEGGIRRYLASGLIPGIGPKYAERIVDRFGARTLEVLDRHSERLRDIPGIGPKRIAEIRSAWKTHAQQRDIQVFLQGLGITPAYCGRIINRYGMSSAEVVRRNPFQLASDVQGIGFLTADRLAQQLGISADNPLRLAAGLLYTLDKLAEQGHTCYPRRALLDEAAPILGVDPPHVEAGLRRALSDGAAVEESAFATGDDALVYHRRLYQAEVELATAVSVLIAQGYEPPEKLPAGALPRTTMVLNEAQRQAVATALTARFSIITGGPGVGKTTVVGHIVQAARRLGLFVLLAAPTGRAAKRLSESTKLEAKTIHRLLKWDPTKREFVHNQHRPLRCDMLVVDEVSMLDVVLAGQLFRAVPPGTRVVLVGDRDQLPSVGPGAVLHDLIHCGRVPVTHLTEIYRQSENSRIVHNAHAVNQGQMPDLRAVPPSVLADFYWIDQDDPERVGDIIARLVTERIPKTFRFDPLTDIQVLTPMHRGNCGAIRLNEILQDSLNAGGAGEVRFGGRRFRTGDRVMQTVNNYDKGVFNGELGQIVDIDRERKVIRIAFDTGVVEYGWHEADQFQLAYAVTVHKSQGSEFPVVVMPILTQHFIMLQRNLVYTGMTRARQLLIMVGMRKALAIAIRNDKPLMRCTALAERLGHSATPA